MRTLTSLILIFFSLQLNAQKDIPKFGRIDPTVFEKKAYAVDSSAPAVILLDLGRTEIVGNRKGWFSMRHTHRKRIHILNKNGYDHANFAVHLYKDSDSETDMENLKCVTYNWEGGKLVETKLEKSQIFNEQVDKYRRRVRITAPAVKEGSVVEYEYTTLSDNYFSLVPWDFQGAIPKLWSEYQFMLPQFMDYLFFSQGYFPFHLKEQKDRTQFFTVASGDVNTRTQSFSCNVTEYRWVMKEVPVLKEERFTSTIDNHVARIEFQLAGYKDPLNPRSIMNDWPSTVNSLMERDDFGKLINANNGWLDEYLKPLLQGAANEEEKARRIYGFVRDGFTCTVTRALIAEQSLRSVVKSQKGSVCELNLLLVAMLRHAGFQADPVILSTRENGYVNAVYPLINRYNYVVAEALVNGRPLFMDASRPQLAFGRIPYYCYNGSARLLDKLATPLSFEPDSLVERQFTLVNISNVNKKWAGHLRYTPGYNEAVDLREAIRSKGKDEYSKEFETDLGSSISMSNFVVDSLRNPDQPLALACDFTFSINDEEILYINPIIKDGYGENPFKAALRYHPVEMPYTLDQVYVATIQVPEGYEVEELPKQARMIMNDEGDAAFDYLISHSGGVISMRVQLKVKRTFFDPSEYAMLREFFNHVVAKEGEQIVFKKKK